MTRAFRRAAASHGSRDRPIPSPNIWNWPDVYEQENRAQDVRRRGLGRPARGVALGGPRRRSTSGCGDGFHLPLFDRVPRSVTGVEPHAPLVARARTRLAAVPGSGCSGRGGGAPAAGRVRGPRARPHRLLLRPGAASRALPRHSGCCGPAGRSRSSTSTRPCRPYGDWMRADIPHYDPAAAERFFARAGLRDAPDPDGVALPGPRDLRGGAAHRVLAARWPSGRSPRPPARRSRWDTGCTCAALSSPAERDARGGRSAPAGLLAHRDRRCAPSRRGSYLPDTRIPIIGGLALAVVPSARTRALPAGPGTVVLAAGLGDHRTADQPPCVAATERGSR